MKSLTESSPRLQLELRRYCGRLVGHLKYPKVTKKVTGVCLLSNTRMRKVTWLLGFLLASFYIQHLKPSYAPGGRLDSIVTMPYGQGHALMHSYGYSASPRSYLGSF